MDPARSPGFSCEPRLMTLNLFIVRQSEHVAREVLGGASRMINTQ